MESWKEIKGFEELYEVSEKGEVRNRYGLILKQRYDKSGYKRVTLTKYENSKKILKTIHIHHLVAHAFIENKLQLECINHKDENKENNNVDNLEWCTRSYNNTFGSKQIKPGETHRVINLNENKIYKSMYAAGKRYGITGGAIYNCCIGKNKTAAGFVWKFI